MGVKNIQSYAVTQTAQEVASTINPALPASDEVPGTRKVYLFNNGNTVIYLGVDATVTSSSGYPLLPGVELVDTDSADPWYAVTASGQTGDLRAFVLYPG